MKKLKLWACTANSDQTEGRGWTETICYAPSKKVAKAIVCSPEFYRMYGVMGCPPYDGGNHAIEPVTIIIYKSAKEYRDSKSTPRRK